MTKKIKKQLRVYSFLLMLVMLMGCLPITAMAETDELIELTPNTDTSEPLADELVELETDTSEVVEEEVIGKIAEVISLREENAKHFRLDNGMYKVVSYSAPVHRLDADGTWQDIDNNLYLQEANGSAQYATNDGRVQFADLFAAGEELFRLSEGEYSITMKWLEPTGGALGNITADSTAQPPQITNAAARPANHTFESIEEAVDVDNTAKIVYNNVRTGIDLEYVLMGNDVKENIIVKNRASSYEYAFQIGLNGLTATLNAAGEVELKDTESGVTQYVIPAPYMYDSAGVYSQAVSYQLAEISTGRYLLLITADATWMNAEERVFPVTVDPTVIDKKIVVDIYTDSTRPDTNLNYENLLLISDTCTTYIRIKLPKLPDGAFCNSAIFHVEYYFTTTSGSVTVGTYQALENWSEVLVTYNDSPPVDTTLLDSLVMTAGAGITASTPAVAEFDVSPAVTAWYAAEIDDVPGFAFKKLSGNTSTVYLKSYELNHARSYYEVDYSYTIPDGVYALRNQHMATSWMKMAESKPIAGIKLEHAVFQASPTDQALTSTINRTSLFKISQKASTGYYVIRSMVNNCLGFGYSNGKIVTVDIPADDESVDDANTFRIEWDGHGFTISPYDSTMVMTLTADSTDIEVIDKVTTVSRYQWDLILYTGNHQSGLGTGVSATWISPGMIVGTEYQIKVIGWSTLSDANWVYMEAVEGENAIQSYWQGYNDKLSSEKINNLVFTPILPGEIVLKAYVRQNSISGTNLSVKEYRYRIIPKEGDYYIQNFETENYIDVEGPSTASGAIIQEWDFHTGLQELWQVEHAGNGYVRFKSQYSNLYLGVNSNAPTVVRQLSSGDDSTLWFIDVSQSSTLYFKCKATPQYTLCVASSTGSNGTNLSQDTSYSDCEEWILYECNYTLNTIQYYDRGFEAIMLRYNVDPASEIANCQTVVSERMMHILGLRVVYNGVTPYTSPVDECVVTAEGSYDTFGTIPECCNHSPQHSLTYGMLRTSSILEGATDLRTVVIWTGHQFQGASSNSNSDSHSIIMMPFNIDASMTIETIRTKYQGTLMHELSHQINAQDHYCNKDLANNIPCTIPTCDLCVRGLGTERECLMTHQDKYSTLPNNDLYCSECLSRISRHLNDHH